MGMISRTLIKAILAREKKGENRNGRKQKPEKG